MNELADIRLLLELILKSISRDEYENYQDRKQAIFNMTRKWSESEKKS